MYPAARLLNLSALLVGGLVFFAPWAEADPPRIKALLEKAAKFEQDAEWDKACDAYDSVLRMNRDTPGVREKYQTSLRRYWQVRRHRDLSYKKEVLSLDYGQSLRLLNKVRDTLLDGSVDRKKLTPATVFRKGLEELHNALSDPGFIQEHLRSAKPESIKEFRDFLEMNWGNTVPDNRAKATKHIKEVALAAQNMLQLDTTVTIMEFVCGACYSIDDYTLYLTPNQLRELCDSLRGEFVGVGIALATMDGKLIVGDMPPQFSPANERFLTKNDRILKINGKPVADLAPEAAKELLDGPNGTTVELEIMSSMGMHRPSVTLTRRPLFMPSIFSTMEDEAVGYLKVLCFQDTTVREIDDALVQLTKVHKMSALILDLRGNSGGLFESAIDTARRFLSAGIITSLEHQDPKKTSLVYESKNPNAHAFPLVVLVDGDTASAAEVLAGALKDNKRARLVGQPTFGKGCTQQLLELGRINGLPTGGLRLTVARFYSPEGQPYSGIGIQPHVMVESLDMAGSSMGGVMDPQKEAAKVEAVRLLQMLR